MLQVASAQREASSAAKGEAETLARPRDAGRGAVLRLYGVVRIVRLGRAAAGLPCGEFLNPAGGFQPKLPVRDEAQAGGRDLHSSVIGGCTMPRLRSGRGVFAVRGYASGR